MAFWGMALSPIFSIVVVPRISAVLAWYFSETNPTLAGFLQVAQSVFGSTVVAILRPVFENLWWVLTTLGWSAFVAAVYALPAMLGWWWYLLIGALLGVF